MRRGKRICNFLMENGKKCESYSLKDDPKGLCFFHSDLTKEQRALASKRGGLVRKEDGDILIKSSFDITTLLNKVINDLRNGHLDSKRANSLIYAANVSLKSIEISEVQQKLEEISRQMQREQKWGRDMPADIYELDPFPGLPEEGDDS